MFKAGYVRVITEELFQNSVRLRDLIHDDTWIAAVEASALKSHYLTLMAYEEFVASPHSRVLSYRWNDKISFKNVPVTDPAQCVSNINGDVALSVLKTPVSSWKILWADALNHLNDAAGVALTISTMGELYLKVPTLPQYFLNGDMATLEEAINRGWMHQELAYGALDRDAVWSFIEILARSMPSHWRGNPFHIPPLMMLMQFVAKRVRSAATELPMDSKLEKLIESRKPDMSYSIDASYASYSDRILGLMMALIGSTSSVFRDYARDKDLSQCKEAVEEFIAEIASPQLHNSVDDNLHTLHSNPVFCLSIIKACCSTNFWDKSDAYVAAISVIGHACGIAVEDPLKDFRAKYTYDTIPRNTDFTLKYSHADLNLEILNRNLELLRICWRTINQGTYMVPYAFRNMNAKSELRVDLTQIPTGMHTLGVGLIPWDRLSTEQPRCVSIGSHGVFLFNENLDGYQVKVSETREGSAVDLDSEEPITAPFPDLDSLADNRYVRYVGPMASDVDGALVPSLYSP